MDKRKRHTVTLGPVLVGALNPAGCSHTRLFVVFLLRREEGYFPEPERRISIARPPSPAAHMTGNAGKPPKTSRKRGMWGMMGSGARHQSSSPQQHCSRVAGPVKASNNHSKTLQPVAQKHLANGTKNMHFLHLRASLSTKAMAVARGLILVVRWCHFPKNTRLPQSSSFTSCWRCEVQLLFLFTASRKPPWRERKKKRI